VIAHTSTIRLPQATPDWERSQVTAKLGDRFQVVRELGRGGMGAVFLARDVALHRLVAIKVLRSEFAGCEEHRERFRREARMTARLSHPNVVPVHMFGEDDEFVYIVMKYVEGESLADRLRREGRIEPAEARSILRDLAQALDYAHREGVVHRDLKAENILIERGSKRPVLTDFGVALLRSLDPVRSESARAFGTPHYMSPEQAAGELDLDGRSDIYSLGVLAYYMLSGELPFDGATFEALAAKHIAEAHIPLKPRVGDESAALAGIVDRCLAKERATRWRNGGEMAEALANVKEKKRRFGSRFGSRSSVARTNVVAELALFATAMKAVLFRWTIV
jgi:serine/threonine protein kinase